VREEGTGPGRSAAVDWIQADIGRAAATLGWRPTYGIADSVKAIWAAAPA
jgi:NDP-hexose 4-ketoreductase